MEVAFDLKYWHCSIACWHIRTAASITSFQPPPSLPVLPTVVPVTDWEHGLLPLQFAVDPGPDLDWARSVSKCQSVNVKV